MIDFETKLKHNLNQSVDARLGTRRTPPPFQPASIRPGGRQALRPWVVPLLAAAGVAAAIAAIVVPVQLSADRPAGRPIGGLVAPPSNAAAPPTEISDPNAPPTLYPPPPPAATAVTLGGAKLRLPVGWVANEVADPHQYGGSSVYSREWCLAPGKSAAAPRADCQLQFGPVAPVTANGIPVNGHVPLGTLPGGNRSSCPVSDFSGTETSWSVASFGQRTGFSMEWHDGFSPEWHGDCPDHLPWVKQYVVDTAPGYVLFSDQMTPELGAAMEEITQYASLPTQTPPLLLYDMGVVRSVTPRSDGYLMTIAPIMRLNDNWVPSGAANRSYLIQQADLKHAVVGTRVGVTTDGTKVIRIGPPISG